MSELPDPPQNVRVELVDGETVACQLVYEGFVDGAHRWAAVTPLPIDQIVGLRADVIPAKTAIILGQQS